MKTLVFTVILLAIMGISSHAEINFKVSDVEQKVNGKFRSNRKIYNYTIKKEKYHSTIKIQERKLKEIIEQIPFPYLANITLSKHTIKENVEACKYRNEIIIFTDTVKTYKLVDIVLHELGHIAQDGMSLDKDIYKYFVYGAGFKAGRGWGNKVREEFAEDFKIWYGDKCFDLYMSFKITKRKYYKERFELLMLIYWG